MKYQPNLQVLAPTLELISTVKRLEKANKICNRLWQGSDLKICLSRLKFGFEFEILEILAFKSSVQSEAADQGSHK